MRFSLGKEAGKIIYFNREMEEWNKFSIYVDNTVSAQKLDMWVRLIHESKWATVTVCFTTTSMSGLL